MYIYIIYIIYNICKSVLGDDGPLKIMIYHVTELQSGNKTFAYLQHFGVCVTVVECVHQVDSEAEGEAQRYFDHALTLRSTIQFLRYNSHLVADSNTTTAGQGIDLLRCESLLSLDPATCARVLHRNYLYVTM